MSFHVISFAAGSPGEHGVNFVVVFGGSSSSTGTWTCRHRNRPNDQVSIFDTRSQFSPERGGGHEEAYLFEVSRAQHFSHGLHERVAHDDGEIRTRVPFSLLGQGAVVALRELARRRADVEVEHFRPRGGVGQRDVDSFLEPIENISLSVSCTRQENERRERVATCRRLIATSRAQGMLVAPRTRTPCVSLPTPFIWTRNSVLIRLDASDSPSPRVPHKESISSTKMMDGAFSRAIANSCFTRLVTHHAERFSRTPRNPTGGEQARATERNERLTARILPSTC